MTIRPLELLYFMAPAYLANMAPPFARYWQGWNRPIHERSLGSHKTVVGAMMGIVTGVLATAAQAAIDAPFGRVDYAYWPLLGVGFGVGAMAGDCLKSLFKRRSGVAPGASWIPFDQLDFPIGALMMVGYWARLSWLDVLFVLAITFIGDLLVNRIAFRFGIKDSAW